MHRLSNTNMSNNSVYWRFARSIENETSVVTVSEANVIVDELRFERKKHHLFDGFVCTLSDIENNLERCRSTTSSKKGIRCQWFDDGHKMHLKSIEEEKKRNY